MSASDSYDVVVMGGGMAGLVAATRAAELGCRTVLIEAGSEEKYLCNSRFTSGLYHLAFQDVEADPQVIEGAIRQAADPASSPELIAAMAANAGRTVRWMRDQGVRFVKAGPEPWNSHILAPPVSNQPWLDWQGRGGDLTLRNLGDRFAQLGGEIRRGVRGRSLLMQDGRCAGLVAETAGGEVTLNAGAVVIADGGFQGDPDLMGEFITPRPEAILARGARTGAGDGLRMARAAGAQLVGLDRFYGHLMAREAMTNDRLWPFPLLDPLTVCGIAVGPDGRRYADEGLGGIYMTNLTAAQPDPLGCLAVFDSVVWEGPARHTRQKIPINPTLERYGAVIHRADDLETLAGLAGLPAEAFTRTVADYNAALETGAELDPPRRTDKHEAFPIRQAPFFAVPMCVGVTYTAGGIAIDGKARVLREDGTPIPGLHAAGSTTGGLDGGPSAGYISGLVKASVFGLLAGETIAQAREESAR